MTCGEIIVASEAQVEDRVAEADVKLKRKMEELLDVNGRRRRQLESTDGKRYRFAE